MLLQWLETQQQSESVESYAAETIEKSDNEKVDEGVYKSLNMNEAETQLKLPKQIIWHEEMSRLNNINSRIIEYGLLWSGDGWYTVTLNENNFDSVLKNEIDLLARLVWGPKVLNLSRNNNQNYIWDILWEILPIDPNNRGQHKLTTKNIWNISNSKENWDYTIYKIQWLAYNEENIDKIQKIYPYADIEETNDGEILVVFNFDKFKNRFFDTRNNRLDNNIDRVFKDNNYAWSNIDITRVFWPTIWKSNIEKKDNLLKLIDSQNTAINDANLSALNIVFNDEKTWINNYPWVHIDFTINSSNQPINLNNISYSLLNPNKPNEYYSPIVYNNQGKKISRKQRTSFTDQQRKGRSWNPENN